MGLCLSCCGGSSDGYGETPDAIVKASQARGSQKVQEQSIQQKPEDDDRTPDADTKRLQLAEAVEKRRQAQEAKGIKDPEALKRKQKRREELEKKAELANSGQDTVLRWQVN